MLIINCFRRSSKIVEIDFSLPVNMKKRFNVIPAQFSEIHQIQFTTQTGHLGNWGNLRELSLTRSKREFNYLIVISTRLNRYEDVAADCRAALELDPSLVKGHFFLGQALCELDMLDDGVKHLQRAVDLAKEQRWQIIIFWKSFLWFEMYRLNFGDEMTQVLRQWRKRRFSIQEEKRLTEEIELQSYLARLIREDRERQV